VRVRQAVNYAVDRQEICDAVYYGYARPTCLPLMPHDLGYTTKKYFPDTADLNKAQQLLDEAGYGDGFETTVITPSATALKREIEVIQAQLAKVNIKLNIDMYDMGAWISQYWVPFDEKQFIMSHGDVDRVTDDSDSGLWWFYYPETIGWTGLDSPEAATLLEDARTAVDPNERHNLYLKILDIVIPQSQYVYLVTRQLSQPTSKNVYNYYAKPKMNFYQFDECYLSG
jgi:peptide/nickel transport system substrate-binding protein